MSTQDRTKQEEQKEKDQKGQARTTGDHKKEKDQVKKQDLQNNKPGNSKEKENKSKSDEKVDKKTVLANLNQKK